MTTPKYPAMPPGGWSPHRDAVPAGAHPPVEAPIPPPRPGQPPRVYGPPRPPEPGLSVLFGGFWPDRDVPARPLVAAGAVAVGLLGGLILPDYYFVSLAGVLVTIGLLLAPLAVSPNRRSAYTWLVAALAAGLISLLVFRSAGWLASLALLVAVPLVFSALNGARTVVDLAVAAITWPLSLLRDLPWVRRSAATVRTLPVGWPVLRTVLLCVAALLVFGALFATGDAVFGSWVEALLPSVDGAQAFKQLFVALVVGALALGSWYTAINPPRPVTLPENPSRPAPRTLQRYEWLAPIVVVIVMFAGFVAAQAATLFAGHDYVQQTAGVTYAESVHKGFGQLTVATLLALLTVAAAWWRAPRESRSDRIALTSALGVLCTLALVVVISALYRMHVYQQAYGFTVLRVVVDAFELWMGLLLLLTMIAVAVRGVAWLPRAALCSGALVVLGLGVMNPEAWIAEKNVERYRDTGKIDSAYLATLGPDARPAIVRGLPPQIAQCSVPPAGRNTAPIEWNLGRQRAADATIDSALSREGCNAGR